LDTRLDLEALSRRHGHSRGLVWGFLASAVDRLAGSARGRGQGLAAIADVTSCRHMFAIFLGKALDYEPVGLWNSGGMVDWMHEAFDHYYKGPESNRDALISQVFARVVVFAYEAVGTHAEKSEPDDLQEVVMNLANDLASFSVGVTGNLSARLFLRLFHWKGG